MGGKAYFRGGGGGGVAIARGAHYQNFTVPRKLLSQLKYCKSHMFFFNIV